MVERPVPCLPYLTSSRYEGYKYKSLALETTRKWNIDKYRKANSITTATDSNNNNNSNKYSTDFVNGFKVTISIKPQLFAGVKHQSTKQSSCSEEVSSYLTPGPHLKEPQPLSSQESCPHRPTRTRSLSSEGISRPSARHTTFSATQFPSYLISRPPRPITSP